MESSTNNLPVEPPAPAVQPPSNNIRRKTVIAVITLVLVALIIGIPILAANRSYQRQKATVGQEITDLDKEIEVSNKKLADSEASLAKTKDRQANSTASATPASTPTDTQSTVATTPNYSFDTSKWQEFTDSERGYSFKYPADIFWAPQDKGSNMLPDNQRRISLDFKTADPKVNRRGLWLFSYPWTSTASDEIVYQVQADGKFRYFDMKASDFTKVVLNGRIALKSNEAKANKYMYILTKKNWMIQYLTMEAFSDLSAKTRVADPYNDALFAAILLTFHFDL